MIKKYLLLTIFSIIICSCEQQTLEPDTNVLGFQFFPIEEGFEQVFSVQEINYRNTGAVDTTFYQIIDRINDVSQHDNSTVYFGYRYRKEPSGIESVLSTLSLTINDYTVMRQLGNKKEIIFIFPVKEGKSWDAFPDPEEQDEYTYFKAFQPFTFSDTVFSQSVQVIAEDNQDSLEFLDTRINIFAAGIGEVESLNSQIEFCTLTECFGMQQIEIGKTIRMQRVLLPE